MDGQPGRKRPHFDVNACGRETFPPSARPIWAVSAYPCGHPGAGALAADRMRMLGAEGGLA